VGSAQHDVKLKDPILPSPDLKILYAKIRNGNKT
jgi:hypothetical protein